MNKLNIEIKCKVTELGTYREKLVLLGADFKGTDEQTDTYFKVSTGRMKLREGNIENSLIRYHRPESMDLKRSEVILQELSSDCRALRTILSNELGVWKIVKKKRSISFIDNVKFHLDEVSGLGSFIEIEAIASDNSHTESELIEQCQKYIDLLSLDRANFIDQSYSDLI